ncbi:hypothetical protein H0A66_02915 [Alcaligenaceae bacterium]|nr:hypothetical protein [Alcaligenaceae bacterium]
MKRKPTGFIAICQCGVITGAMDATRTEKADAGRILGKWLNDGCTVEPRFTGTWMETVSPCKCNQEQGYKS